MNIVLVEPEIPQNTGAAGRLALATGSPLHLIKPLGFSIDEKTVRRTGLDYWRDVDLKVWENIEEFHAANPEARLWFLSTKASQGIWDVKFEEDDFLLFGRESKGLPESWIFGSPESAIKIPMREDSTRSLNLACSVAIVLYEAERQLSLK